jgi:alpha-glucosidase
MLISDHERQQLPTVPLPAQALAPRTPAAQAPAAQVLHRADPDDARWWRHAVIYQVYPRSFSDSDGDGMGDLRGITDRLDHLVELGADALWLSPFYPSPQADAGYDVADYRDVDPMFGRLEDADKLFARAHALGLRVIIDLVPNHTSDQHPWFRAALAAAPGGAERARYIFRDGRGTGGERPPNDWRSVFGGPAWTRVVEPDGRPGQWYLHLFDTAQPDLNWDNSEVRAEFEDVLRFWLDRGVDGFRVDVASGLVKQADLPDWEARQTSPVLGITQGDTPPPMWDQEGVHAIYRSWRRLCDSYDGDRILVAEAWVEPAERLARYVRPDEMHQAFNFEYLLTPWSAADIREVVTRSLVAADAVGAPVTWVLSSHDVVRHASRLGLPDGERVSGAGGGSGIGIGDPQPDTALGLRRARAATLLMLGLPGSAYLYQGEELGLPDHTTLPDEARQDPTWRRSGRRGRDGCRVPIPWEAGAPSYGFGPADRSWLPQPPSWAEYALDRQRGAPGSTYELYRAALRLRRSLGLGHGSLAWLQPTRDQVVAFVNRDVLVLANLGPEPVPLPDGAELLLASAPLDQDDRVPTDVTAWARVTEAGCRR